MLHKDFFVADTLHKRTIKLADGSEFELSFRETTAVDFRRFLMSEKSEDEEKQSFSVAKLISQSLCDDDGKPAMTFEQAKKLKPFVANELLSVILEINGIGSKPGKV